MACAPARAATVALTGAMLLRATPLLAHDLVPVLPAVLYAAGVRNVWRTGGRGRGISRRAAGCFAAGVAALIVALVSPLDALGGALFSAHMLQHIVLMLVAAPLLVLGRPLVAFVWALPPRARGRAASFARWQPFRHGWGAVSHPFAAWVLHAAALWIWHAPRLYEATLYSEFVHFVQHACFVGTALLFWWAALELGRRTSQRHGAGLLYVFTTAVHSSVLGALLTFSLVLWYPVYADRSVLWGLSPLEDQQLGGLIMWVPAGMIYLAAALLLVAAWLAAAERRAEVLGAARGSAAGNG